MWSAQRVLHTIFAGALGLFGITMFTNQFFLLTALSGVMLLGLAYWHMPWMVAAADLTVAVLVLTYLVLFTTGISKGVEWQQFAFRVAFGAAAVVGVILFGIAFYIDVWRKRQRRESALLR